MKLFRTIAAIAFAVAAAPAIADSAATTMSEADCTAAWEKCMGDATCQNNLVQQGCKAPEAAPAATPAQ